MVLLLAINVT
ncbi:hypothetical protein AVEN_255495-1, partial [Araneus ventricosus]